MRSGGRGGLPAKILLLALGFLLPLACLEIGLRVVGFSFSLAPSSVEFGFPNPSQMANQYAPDPDLFWVLKKYPSTLERLADRNPEIIFMGDSCTQPSWGRYPKFFMRRLKTLAEGRKPRGIALGVAGWSSFQGRRQLERDVISLNPRVVTIYFGWNDHWLAYGIDDQTLGEMSSGQSIFPLLGEMRVWQLALKARIGLISRNRDEWPHRVSSDQFFENLTQMVRLARGAKIVPVLITAPSAPNPSVAQEHVLERWVHDLDEVVPLHSRYVEIVRQVAQHEGAPLCDLAKHFDSIPPSERETYFTADGIHLQKNGDELISTLLLECFESNSELARVLADLKVLPGVEGSE